VLAAPAFSVDTEGDVFSYSLSDSATGELLYWMSSAYQPEKTGTRSFAEGKTADVSIHWNEEQAIAVVEEANHSSMGELWILTTDGTASRISDLFTPEVKQRILDSTDLPWERHRFFFMRWESADTVVIRLAGKFYLNEQKNATIGATFDITLKWAEAQPVTQIVRIKE